MDLTYIHEIVKPVTVAEVTAPITVAEVTAPITVAEITAQLNALIKGIDYVAGQSGIDASAEALISISYGHHEVHEGNSYWAGFNATLTNGQELNFALQTPDSDALLHMLIVLDITAVCTFTLTEGCTISGGSAGVDYNRRRSSENVSGATIKTGSTGGEDIITPTGGTVIWTETFGVRAIAWSRNNGEEVILKPNTIYFFKVLNGTTTQNVTLRLDYYLHADKNTI